MAGENGPWKLAASWVTPSLSTGVQTNFPLTNIGDVRRVIVSPLTAGSQRWGFSNTGNMPVLTTDINSTGRSNELAIVAGTTTTHAMFYPDFISPDSGITSIGVYNNHTATITAAIYVYYAAPKASELCF